MDLQIRGKVALVTGASKGIGFATAYGLAQEGAQVVVSARDETRVHDAVERIRVAGGEAFGIPADVSSAQSIEALFEALPQYGGMPDILVVNGGGPTTGLATALEDEAWIAATDLLLLAAVRLTRKALPHMLEQQWGRVINITSISVKQPVQNLALSNALRAGVTSYAKTLALEVADQGVTVNGVAPGYTMTERVQTLYPDEAKQQQLAQTIPAKRFATSDEVAAAAIFLASQQAAYITGQTVVVGGGAYKGL